MLSIQFQNNHLCVLFHRDCHLPVVIKNFALPTSVRHVRAFKYAMSQNNAKYNFLTISYQLKNRRHLQSEKEKTKKPRKSQAIKRLKIAKAKELKTHI
jgi:hypothetical protein